MKQNELEPHKDLKAHFQLLSSPHLPNGIKYAIKMSSDINELIDTVDNKVAAIATVADHG
jgi:hypothetical protein